MKNRLQNIGRNDLCPCGSGQKYKKCCMAKDEEAALELLTQNPLETKTMLDEYAFLFRGIVIYGQGQMGDSPYTRALQNEYERFEKHFHPGLDSDISDGLFIPWFYLDYRYGKDQKTLAERFIEEGFAKGLRDPGPQLMGHLAESYCAFYEIREILEDHLILLELGTGSRWRVSRTGEAPEQSPVAGEFWYSRLVGTLEEAWFFMAPYVYPPKAGTWIKKVIEENKENFARYSGAHPADFTQKEFRDTSKAAVQFWAGIFSGNPLPPRKMEAARKMPELANTDGEPLRFSKMFFRILTREGLEERLGSLPGVEYHSANRQWVWSKKGNRRIKLFPSTILANLRIEKDRLIAETNSMERALKLKNKLTRSCKAWLAYEKIEANDFASLPPLTKAEHEKFEREQEELKKNPEVRKFMKQQAEDYYYKEWLRAKIPALGNKTPLQAAKTVLGRAQLEALLSEFEERQKSQAPDDLFRFDMNELRRILGLTP